jgi:hypothetical protein
LEAVARNGSDVGAGGHGPRPVGDEERALVARPWEWRQREGELEGEAAVPHIAHCGVQSRGGRGRGRSGASAQEGGPGGVSAERVQAQGGVEDRDGAREAGVQAGHSGAHDVRPNHPAARRHGVALRVRAGPGRRHRHRIAEGLAFPSTLHIHFAEIFRLLESSVRIW